MLEKLKNFRLSNYIYQVRHLRTWGHFSLLPIVLIGYTTKLNGYYAIEIGWGRWYLSLDIIPKDY